MAGLELDPQARDLAANVVKGVLTPEAAAAQAKVPVETVNQWVATYIADAKASFEARAKSLLSQTKAGLLPQSGRSRQRGFSSTSAGVGMGMGNTNMSSTRSPLPAPTPFQSPSAQSVPAAQIAPPAASANPPASAKGLPPLGAPPPAARPPVASAPVVAAPPPPAFSARPQSIATPSPALEASASAPVNAVPKAPASAPVNVAPPASAPRNIVPEAPDPVDAHLATTHSPLTEAPAPELSMSMAHASMPVAYPLPKPMAVDASYSGKVEGDAVLDAARSLAAMQQSGVIVIETESEAGTIYFESGEIVDAGFRGLRGQDALWKLLDVSKGTFDVEGYSPPNERTIEATSTALLSEANRRRTIGRHLKKHLGSSQQVFALVPLTREQLVGLGKIDTQLLALFDGKRTLKQVVGESMLDEFTALSQIQRMHDKGHLVPTSLRPVEVPLVPSSMPAPTRTTSSPSIPAELPFKQRRLGKWLGGAAIAAGGMMAGGLLVATGSLSSDAGANVLSSIGLGDDGEDGASAAAVSVPNICTTPVVVAAAEETTKPSCPEGMAYIAPGHFTMGTNDHSPALAAATPAHSVEVAKGYCIDRVEVTADAYNRCVANSKCPASTNQAAWAQTGENEKTWEASLILHGKQCNAGADDRTRHPINCVSWSQAKNYCEALGHRLPTEAEWEFAARGPDSRSFPWGETKPEAQLLNACGSECREWHENVGLAGEVASPLYEVGDGFSGTSPVGAFGLGATPEGVLDLAGNVFEWTIDTAREYGTTGASAAAESERHMVRGGAFNSTNLESVDPVYRFAMPNETLSPAIGFRCASTP